MTGAAAAGLVGLVGLAAVAVVQARHNQDLRVANEKTIDALKAETQAKKDTQEALAKSEESRKRAEAVLGFLKDDVLAAARPEGQEGGLGVDVTVRKAIDAAESKIAERFKDQPLVEAEVRDTLGGTYYYLREATQAIRQFERALELRRDKSRPRPPRHARKPQQSRRGIRCCWSQQRRHHDARGDSQAQGVEARSRRPRYAC